MGYMLGKGLNFRQLGPHQSPRDYLVEDLERYRERCRDHEKSASLAYLGLDFIIDVNGKVHCLEVNGQDSGTKGFKEAYGHNFARYDTLHRLASYGLPVSVYKYGVEWEEKKWAEIEGLRIKFKDVSGVQKQTLRLQSQVERETFCGNRDASNLELHERLRTLSPTESILLQLQYRQKLEEELRSQNLPDTNLERYRERSRKHSFKEVEGIVWTNCAEQLFFDGNGVIQVNDPGMELILESKIYTALLMSPAMSRTFGGHMNEVLGDTAEFREDFTLFLREISGEELVVKPDMGRCGEGVVTLPKRVFMDFQGKLLHSFAEVLEDPESFSKDDNILEALVTLKQASGIVVEPFVESQPYISPKTGKYHRGCIRSIAVIESQEGRIKLNCMGSYVRLAPEPIDEKVRSEGQSSLRSKIANLSLGGHGIPLSHKEHRQLERWMRRYLPSFYRRLLRASGEPTAHPLNAVCLDSFPEYFTKVDLSSPIWNPIII